VACKKYRQLLLLGIFCTTLNPQLQTVCLYHKVNRFVLPKDKLERLVSRLLQRYAICHAHGFSGSSSGEFQILRTSANKPYLKPEDCAPDLKNWNYSVSHQNQLVVFYSSSVSQIGIDLVQLTDDRHNVQGLSLDRWFQRFHAKLDPEEWLHINQCVEYYTITLFLTNILNHCISLVNCLCLP